MELKSIIDAWYTDTEGTLCLLTTQLDEDTGITSEEYYILADGDNYGLAPEIREVFTASGAVPKAWEDCPLRDDEFVEPEPEPDVTIISAVTLWERMSEDEAEQVETVMAMQPFRTRQIFMTAQTFRSDHELWPLLTHMAAELFGEERASELLAAG